MMKFNLNIIVYDNILVSIFTHFILLKSIIIGLGDETGFAGWFLKQGQSG